MGIQVREDCSTKFRSICALVSDETIGMLGGKLNVLFFDVTTLSFASENDDELRKKASARMESRTGCKWFLYWCKPTRDSR